MKRLSETENAKLDELIRQAVASGTFAELDREQLGAEARACRRRRRLRRLALVAVIVTATLSVVLSVLCYPSR